MLRAAGIDATSITSSMSTRERDTVVAVFNNSNPYTSIQVLITGINLSSFGLDLYKACCKVIAGQLYQSLATIMQGIAPPLQLRFPVHVGLG